MKIPSISLGTSSKKSRFSLDHDVNTTSNFGFCQPTLFQEVVANSSIRLASSSFVRLGVMPTPSFARVQSKMYTSYVKMSDVFEAYGNMLSGIPYVTSNSMATTAPSKVDSMTMGDLLTLFLFSESSLLVHPYPVVPFVACIWPLEDREGNPLVPVSDGRRLIDYGSFSDSPLNWFLANGSLDTFGDGNSHFHSVFDAGYALAVGLDSYNGQNYSASSYSYLKPSYQNADFVFRMTETGGDDVLVTFHATSMGRNLLRVLNGLGYSFRYLSKDVSLLPLFAYYKAWFDLFNPGRSRDWRQTSCYKLIHHYYDYPQVTTLQWALDSLRSAPSYGVGGFAHLTAFIVYLSQCFYSEMPDALTCSLETLSLQGSASTVPSLSMPVDVGRSGVQSDSVASGTGSLPQSSTEGLLYSVTLKALQRMLPYINANSIIGSRVNDYLKTHYNISIPEKTLISSASSNIDIEPVFSQAETADASLGEYAGKGVGVSKQDFIKFSFNEPGYVVQLFCIVPLSGYSQALSSSVSRVDRLDFYDSAYDSLGMEAVGKSEIFGQSYEFDSGSGAQDEVFGFRPRFMNYKYRTNIRSGDFNRRGTLAYMMPYCLDKFFTQPSFDDEGNYQSGVSQQVSESLRFLGFNESYGNFDRLFVDSLGVSDNFIVHMIHNFEYFAPFKPISQSFDTYDPETSDGTRNIVHS